MQDKVGEVPVARTWIRPSGSGRVIPRLLCALSFSVSAAVYGLLSRFRHDVLISESPPLTVGPLGALLAKRARAKHIMNVSDLWPRSLIEMGVLHPGPVARLAYAVERYSYKSARMVTGQSPDIVDDIASRFPGLDVRLLSNGVDTTLFHPGLRSSAVRRSLGVETGTLVTYAGLHGMAQGLEAVVEAAYLLRQTKGLEFRFIGEGPVKTALVRRAESLGLVNVRFLPAMPREEVRSILASSDIIVVPLARPLFGAVPSKLYEAMASGVPVVVATGGGAHRIVEESGAGLSVTPGNAHEIAEAIQRLALDADLRQKCGQAGREYVCSYFDRKLWVAKLAQYVEEIA